MNTITTEQLINKVTTLASLMLAYIKQGDMEKAGAIADEIANTVYHFRRLTEVLTVDENK